eukprot:gb/GFBE01043255.1/.p1 GENE.gb/GFBE01043255.1/~~gb/GFBE01043255.1/.p1  ORF type:complete len:351 (+),score=78.31 gb/GFBE01043255.1/:1-1053(+)
MAAHCVAHARARLWSMPRLAAGHARLKSTWAEAEMPAGMVDVAGSLREAAVGTAQQALNTLKPAFAHASPLRPAFETGRHLANTALRSVDSPVQVQVSKVCASSVLHGEGDRAHISSWSGTSLVANREIQAYVDCILQQSDDVVNHPWIPDAVERRVYVLVVKIVLQMVHFGCGVIDERQLFGQTLRMVQSRSDYPLERAEVTLSPDMIDGIIKQVMVDSGDSTIVSKSVDQLLYQNAIRFALRLVVDMASSLRISTFGLKFSIKVELDAANSLKTEYRSPMDVAALEKVCEPMVEELLADDEVNISMLPDHLEKQLYMNVFRLLANVAAAAVDSSEIDLFGIRIDPDVK